MKIKNFQFSIGRLLAATFLFAVVVRLLQRLDTSVYDIILGVYNGLYPIRWFFGSDVGWEGPNESLTIGIGFMLGILLSFLIVLISIAVFIALLQYVFTGQSPKDKNTDDYANF